MKKDLELSVKIKYNQAEDRYEKLIISHPLSVCFKITEKCNFKCVHCVSSSSIDSFPGLPIYETKKILNILKKNMIARINFSGGEPFIRRDFEEIVIYSLKLGFEIVITSNGSLINRRVANYLEDKNVSVQISMDGEKEANDHLRGRGTYELAVKAVKILRQHRINTIINCTVHKFNKNSIDYLVGFAEKNSIKKIYFNLIRPQGRAKKMEELCLDFSEYDEFYRKYEILKNITELNYGILDLSKYPKGFLLIEANGDLISQGCDSSNSYKAGNILTDDLVKMWQNTEIFNHESHLMHYINH